MRVNRFNGALLSTFVIASIVAAGLLSVHLGAIRGSSKISATTGYENISSEEAKGMIDSGQKIILLDVRTPAEYESGHISGAILYPLQELEGTIPSFDENINIIVYCGTGARSENACRILLENGFNHVYNLIGGLTAWKEAGFQVIDTKNENCPCHQNSGVLPQGNSIDVSQDNLILTIYPTDDIYVWSLYQNSNYSVCSPPSAVDNNALHTAGVLNGRFVVVGIALTNVWGLGRNRIKLV